MSETSAVSSWDDLESYILMPFDPEWVGRAPKEIYAIKYRGECQDGKTRTYIFLFGSKAAYDQRIAGQEKGEALIGRVTWEPVNRSPGAAGKSTKRRKRPPQAESLF